MTKESRNARIEHLLGAGMSRTQIAVEVGVSIGVVNGVAYRARRAATKPPRQPKLTVARAKRQRSTRSKLAVPASASSRAVRWTASVVQIVRVLAADNASTQEMAEATGLTSPEIPILMGTHRIRRPADVEREALLRAGFDARLAHIDAELPPQGAPQTLVTGCRWITGDTRRDGIWQMCGRSRRSGSFYCDGHHAHAVKSA